MNDESEHVIFRDHLVRLENLVESLADKTDKKLGIMVDSVNKFAISAAQNEILYRQFETAIKEIKAEFALLAARMVTVETHQVRHEERSKPMSWLAGTVGTVIVTSLVTSAMALILIK